MTAKTHLLIGAVVAYGATLVWQEAYQAKEIFLVSAMAGSLLPDIDEPNSFIGKRSKIISYPLNTIFGHRTITHNLLLYVAIVIYGIFSKNFYLIGLAVGAGLHILADALTESGVRGGVYPLSDNFALLPRGLRISVGGFAEEIFFWVLSASFVYVFYILR